MRQPDGEAAGVSDTHLDKPAPQFGVVESQQQPAVLDVKAHEGHEGLRGQATSLNLSPGDERLMAGSQDGRSNAIAGLLEFRVSTRHSHRQINFHCVSLGSTVADGDEGSSGGLYPGWCSDLNLNLISVCY